MLSSRRLDVGTCDLRLASLMQVGHVQLSECLSFEPLILMPDTMFLSTKTLMSVVLLCPRRA